MKLSSELVVGLASFQKSYLVADKLNSFGSLMFPMNRLSKIGIWNGATETDANSQPLCDTSAMPITMGSSVMAIQYTYAVVTGSSIAITIKLLQQAFDRTGDEATDAVYTANLSNKMYFALVPFNSKLTDASEELNDMPWQQIIRQPGARRMGLSALTGKSQGTLRAYTNIGKIDGTPMWESDILYRCAAQGDPVDPEDPWSEPANTPMWMLFAYYPYEGSFNTSSPRFEVNIKMTQHATFFMPRISVPVASTVAGESKVVINEGKAFDLDLDDEEKVDPDDDDPSLLDMTTFVVTEPKEEKKVSPAKKKAKPIAKPKPLTKRARPLAEVLKEAVPSKAV